MMTSIFFFFLKILNNLYNQHGFEPTTPKIKGHMFHQLSQPGAPKWNCSLLVYRNTTGTCVLILYPVTLLNFTSSNSFLVESLEFSIYRIPSSANEDKFYFFLPIAHILLNHSILAFDTFNPWPILK